MGREAICGGLEPPQKTETVRLWDAEKSRRVWQMWTGGGCGPQPCFLERWETPGLQREGTLTNHPPGGAESYRLQAALGRGGGGGRERSPPKRQITGIATDFREGEANPRYQQMAGSPLKSSRGVIAHQFSTILHLL